MKRGQNPQFFFCFLAPPQKSLCAHRSPTISTASRHNLASPTISHESQKHKTSAHKIYAAPLLRDTDVVEQRQPARHNRSGLGRGERYRHWPSVDDQRANDANRQRHVANDILAVCADDGAVEGVGIQGFVREARKGNGRCTRGSFAFASVGQQLAETSVFHMADAIAERFECYSRALSFAAVVASMYVRRSPVARAPSSASSRCAHLTIEQHAHYFSITRSVRSRIK